MFTRCHLFCFKEHLVSSDGGRYERGVDVPFSMSDASSSPNDYPTFIQLSGVRISLLLREWNESQCPFQSSTIAHTTWVCTTLGVCGSGFAEGESLLMIRCSPILLCCYIVVCGLQPPRLCLRKEVIRDIKLFFAAWLTFGTGIYFIPLGDWILRVLLFFLT